MRHVTRVEISERDFTAQTIELAHLFRWTVAHFRAAMNRSGRWSTPVQGDGVGFPDLILVRGHRGIAAELKVGRNKATEAQTDWLERFARAGFEAHVWRPEDLEEIGRTLR